MKKITTLILIILIIFSITPAWSQETEPDLVIAVSPFENTRGNRDNNYIGFQISEFLSSALSAFEGVRVVERGQLQEILQEAELQLSGLTDPETRTQVGNLLNAQQMLIGSFQAGERRISVTGRIVDVETGEVLAQGNASSEQTADFQSVYRAFLFELISNLPEYEVTVPVEAQLQTIDSQAQEASENYARALEALFRNNDQEAVEYLEQSIQGEDIDYLRFDEMAQAYNQALTELEGASMYARLIEEQLNTNRELSRQINPLSQYQATLRVVRDRVAALITAGSFEIQTMMPSSDTWEMGDVSVSAPLPQEIDVSLIDAVEEAIEDVFREQEILNLTPTRLHYPIRPPENDLVSRDALNRLFQMHWRADIGFRIEFLDHSGEVLFSVRSTPGTVFELKSSRRRFGDRITANYSVLQNREGWQLNRDGQVEIQARELRDLASARIVLDEESFSIDSGFPVYEESIWQSIIAHAFRKYSVHIAAEDDSPVFKHVMITDSWFVTGDDELDPIPLLPRDGTISAFAELSGVVYFGDSASGAVSASWEGAFEADLQPITSDFTQNSVIIFSDAPRPISIPEAEPDGIAGVGQSMHGIQTDRDTLETGNIRFTARFTQSSETAEAELNRGNSWSFDRWTAQSIADTNRIYVSGPNGTTALDAHTGSTLWTVSGQSWLMTHNTDILYLSGELGNSPVSGIDPETGEELWAGPNGRVQAWNSNTVYINNENIVAIDNATGGEVFVTHEDFIHIAATENRLFAADSYEIHELDPATGRIIASMQMNVEKMQAHNGIVYVLQNRPNRIIALNIAEDREIWEQNVSGDTMIIHNDRIYVSRSGHTTYCFNAATGSRIWAAAIGSSNISITEDFVYIYDRPWLFALNRDSGEIQWAVRTRGYQDFSASENQIILIDYMEGTPAQSLDLSVFRTAETAIYSEEPTAGTAGLSIGLDFAAEVRFTSIPNNQSPETPYIGLDAAITHRIFPEPWLFWRAGFYYNMYGSCLFRPDIPEGLSFGFAIPVFTYPLDTANNSLAALELGYRRNGFFSTEGTAWMDTVTISGAADILFPFELVVTIDLGTQWDFQGEVNTLFSLGLGHWF